MITTDGNRRCWLLIAIAMVSALVATFPLAVSNAGRGFIACLFSVLTVFVILIVVGLIVYRRSPESQLTIVFMALLYVGTTWTLLGGYVFDAIRIRELYRWVLSSNRYRATVLAQPASVGGDLKYTEWDGWRLAGSATVSYLVYDPSDSLRLLARAHIPQKLKGVPCGVARIDRLQSRWYSVVLFTDTCRNASN
jgi:hypothetical protein